MEGGVDNPASQHDYRTPTTTTTAAVAAAAVAAPLLLLFPPPPNLVRSGCKCLVCRVFACRVEQRGNGARALCSRGRARVRWTAHGGASPKYLTVALA